MPAVVSCPQCRQNLHLPEQLIGSTVRCPMCQRAFTASLDSVSAGPPPLPSGVPSGGAPAGPAPAVSAPSAPAPSAPAPSAPAPSAPAEEEYEKPLEDPGEKKRKRRKELSRYGTGTGGLYGDLMKEQRRKATEHRGVLILVFGIVSITCAAGIVGLIFAIITYNMATNDLNEMMSGRMDRSGETLTKTGRILALIGGGLFVVELVTVPCLCMLGALGPH